MNPSICRMVVYVETRPDQLGREKAAVVTGINPLSPMSVNLHVFEPLDTIEHNGPPFAPVTAVGSVPYSESGDPGSWHWPPRV